MKDIVVVIFSRNRSLQCDLTLSTLHARCPDIDLADVVVLYKADEQHEKSYFQLEEDWMQKVDFVDEGNFKEDLLWLLEDKKYVLFVVDDCIFTHDFTLEDVVKSLDEQKRAIGFSLRVGHNTSYCYTVNKEQMLPTLKLVPYRKSRIYNWTTAELDFAYPAEVSSSMYRIKDFIKMIDSYLFNCPNTLEALFSFLPRNTPTGKKMPWLLCYEQSVAFCNPCNKVQTVVPNNRSGRNIKYAPAGLLSLYEAGLRIDPEKFNGFVSNSTHMEVDLI